MTRPLVQLEKVDVALEGKPVLSGIDWSLRRGEHWAIVGRNGSGKSTFLKLVRGELWPAPGRSGRRVYCFDGDEQTTAIGIKQRIALVSPELQARYLQQDWVLTALQTIQSGFGDGDYVYQKLNPTQREAALASARWLGVEELLNRNVQTLSSGELRKVLVARALVGRPTVLACDEICDGLDGSSRLSLLQALERLAQQGIGLLYCTHRDEELLPVLTHRLRLERGRVAECGRMAASELTLATTPRVVSRNHLNSHPPKTCPPLRSGPIRIQIRSADVYQDHRPALRGISWTIHAGEHWALLGPNGSGKTTLLKLVAGDLHPALGGRVRRFNFTSQNTLWEVRRRVGWVSAEFQANYRERLTAAEVVASGFHSSVGLNQPIPRKQWRRVAEILATLDLETLAERSALELSYGEFRKILIARALVHQPELLLCDEPFDGLDGRSRTELTGMLEAVARGGTGLIVVTHHPWDLPACVTHVASMASGKIVCQETLAGFRKRAPAGPENESAPGIP